MSCHCSLLPSGLLRPERENPIPEQGVATQDSLIESKGPTLRAPLHMFCTLLGVPSWVRFCQQEFWKFPWPAGAVGSYSSGPPAGGTTQILVDKTSPMTGRLRVYLTWCDFLTTWFTWCKARSAAMLLMASGGSAPSGFWIVHCIEEKFYLIFEGIALALAIQ